MWSPLKNEPPEPVSQVISNSRVLTRTGKILEISAGGWKQMFPDLPPLKQVGGSFQQVWIGVTNDDEIYAQTVQFDSNFPAAPRKIPGSLKCVTWGGLGGNNPAGGTWGVNSVDDIWRAELFSSGSYPGCGPAFATPNWQHVAGKLQWVSMGNGGLWGLNSAHRLYRWKGGNTLGPNFADIEEIPQLAFGRPVMYLDAGEGMEVVVLDEKGQCWALEMQSAWAGKWVAVPGKAGFVSATYTGNWFAAVDPNGEVWTTVAG